MGLGHSPKIVTSGLVLCLDAGNAKSYPGSGATWTNIINNANHLTWSNTPTFSANNGGRFEFNSTSNKGSMSATGLILEGNNFTIENWIMMTSVPTTSPRQTVIMTSAQSGNILEYGLRSTDGGISITQLYLYSQISGLFIAFDQVFALNTWYHNVLTRSSAGIYNHYVNGNLKTTTTNSAALPTSTTSYDMFYNNQSAGFEYYFRGNCSVHKMYNKVLSADEINQNYNALKERYGL